MLRVAQSTELLMCYRITASIFGQHLFTSLANKYKPSPAVGDASVTCREREGARKQYPKLTFPLDSMQKNKKDLREVYSKFQETQRRLNRVKNKVIVNLGSFYHEF